MKYIHLLSLAMLLGSCKKDTGVEGEQQPPLPTPINIAFSSVSPNLITIYWEDNSSIEEGFAIDRQRGNESFSEVGRVGANVTSYDDLSIDTLQNYSYRVSAFRGNQHSSYSTVLKIAFLPEQEITIHRLTQHTWTVHGVAFSPDGTILASASGDNSTKLWRVSDGSLVRSALGSAIAVAFHPNGDLFAIGGYREARICRVSDGAVLYTLSDTSDWVSGIAFSPDGATLATGSQSGIVKFWRVSNGTVIRTVIAGNSWSVSFSPDGSTLAVGGPGGVRLIRFSDGGVLWTSAGGGLGVMFSPDGTLLADADYWGNIRIWRSSDGVQVRSWQAHSGASRAVTFSADGQRLFTAGDDSVAGMWRVSDGALLRVFRGHADRIYDVALSPSDTILATASGDRSVRTWDLNHQSPRKWMLRRS